MIMRSTNLSIWILLLSHLRTGYGFTLGHFPSRPNRALPFFMVEASMQDPTISSTMIHVTLVKPLGFILTEVNENSPDGIIISQVKPDGSAYSSPFKEQLLGSKIITINNIHVEQMMFDDIMNIIASSESPVHLAVLPVLSSASNPTIPSTAASTTVQQQQLPVGTAVQLTVSLAGESKITTIDAKVGDNLRKTLLDNNIELYRGWKKKLGNCGGGGQCTFCAVDVIETNMDCWEPRSEYEDSKIGRKMGVHGRLACLTNIQGSANIVIPP